MDTGVYFAALRRHSRIVIAGLALAILLAILASVRVSLSPLGVEPKLLPAYSTTSQILVTQSGAPASRVTLTPTDGPRDQAGQIISSFGDPTRFEYLARLYAELANSAVVRRQVLGKDGFQRNNLLVLDGGNVAGTYTAAAYTADQGSLPLISISAESTTPAASNEIARRATAALQRYLAATQRNASVPAKNRVELVVVTPPTLAKQVKGRPVIMPVAVFALVLLATGFAVFFVESLKRDATVVEAVPDETDGSGRGDNAVPELRPHTRPQKASRASERGWKRGRPAAVDGETAPTEQPTDGLPARAVRWGSGSRAAGSDISQR